MAPAGDALRRGHHGVRADDRRAVPDHPPRPAVAVLLAGAVSERAADLAELPLAAGVGLLRHQHLPDRQRAVPAAADDSGLRRRPRQVHRAAPEDLRRAGARLARHAEAVAPARNRDVDHGGRDPAGGRLGAHHRVVRLLDGAGADVAVDDLRPLLRGRRDLQRHRRPHHRDGGAAQVPAPRDLPAAGALREPRQAAAGDGRAVGLLRLQRAAGHLLRQRAGRDGGVLADAARVVRAALLDDGHLQLRDAAHPDGHQVDAPDHHRLRDRVARRRGRDVARAVPHHRAVARPQVPALHLRHLPAAAGRDDHRRRDVRRDGAALRALRQGRADHLDLGAEDARARARRRPCARDRRASLGEVRP